jgi:hypothetical protein
MPLDFEFWPAVIAGLIGGIGMSMTIMLAKRLGWTQMDMSIIEGAMFSGDRGTAKMLGMMTHLVVMSALIIGSIYAAVFAWLAIAPENAWWVGALLGIVHGLIGGMMMAMLPAMHPRMGDSGGAVPAMATGPDMQLAPPGAFALNYGATSSAMSVMGAHVVYGLLVGAVYAWLAG